MVLKEKLRGTGVAIITPFNEKEEVDFNALEKVINFNIENGVEYIVSLGTTGETPTLEKSEKIDIIHFTTEKVNNRVPIVVGVGGNNTKEVIKDLEILPLNNAIAVLSASPYYNKPSQEGLYMHYKLLSESSSKPIILYNVPGRTGRNLNASTTIQLSHECKNIVGIKEASGDLAQCMQIIKDCQKDFLVVSGDDHLAMPQIACGMQGVISVAANCFPKDFSNMVRAALSNDFNTARELQYKMLEGYDILFAENNPAGVKAFLFEMGLIENKFRLPVTKLSLPQHQRVVKFLNK